MRYVGSIEVEELLAKLSSNGCLRRGINAEEVVKELIRADLININYILLKDLRKLFRYYRLRTPVLFYEGSIPKCRFYVGIGGPRRTSDWVLRLAYEVSYSIASSGACIVSGLALGVDAEAHKAALDSGSKTLAVLPWLRPVTPKTNESLAKKIIELEGCLMSEYPVKLASWDRAFVKKLFIRRNRVITAISSVFIAIEPSVDGGTAKALAYAKKQGRWVMVLSSGRYPEKLAVKNGWAYVRIDRCGDVGSIADHVKKLVINYLKLSLGMERYVKEG